MVRARVRLPGFCMSHAAARVKDRSQPQQCKQSYNSIYSTDDKADSSSNSIEMNFNGDILKPEPEGGNRVMVVVGSSLEARGALQWALSHTVQNQDTIVLLHVSKPSKQGAKSEEQRPYELLCSMKEMCQMRRPGVNIEIAVVEGKEKGPAIVEEAKKQRVSLLVLGQTKPSTVWRRLQKLWTGKRTRSRLVEYCIQNAHCMTIAVRRKSRNYGGGYLITTKRHKNFWLLA